MRIISGIYKSRKLIPPPSDKIRPTSDRAKETLFNLLNNIIDLEEIVCFDLFCGTGNLGLECISRGAAKCYFVDNDVKAVLKNIETLGAQDKCKAIKMEVTDFLTGNFDLKPNLVFCDPPYKYEDYDKLLKLILPMKTTLVLEHSKDFNVTNDLKEFVLRQKKVGTVNFTFFNFKN